MELSKIMARSIRELMDKRDLTQRELGLLAGLDQPIIHRLLSGENTSPKLETLERIAQALRVRTFELFMTESERRALRKTMGRKS